MTMCLKIAVLSLVCLGSLAARKVLEKRQVGAVIEGKDDNVPAETGFADPAAAVHAGSRFFQDIYMAMEKPGELQFGHVSETPHDWEQRFEKINLDNLKRQGKVRWGDKHGGYGEHYWDYNHAGHNGDSEESQENAEYAAYEEESQNVPIVAENIPNQRGKRQPQLNQDVEFINDKARSLILESGKSQKHGGNYRRAKDARGKREQTKNFGRSLVFDPKIGLIVDEDTGIRYELKPFSY